MDWTASAGKEGTPEAPAGSERAGPWPKPAVLPPAAVEAERAEIARLREQLHAAQLAIARDPASGLDNRASFSAALDRLTADAAAGGIQLAVMLIGVEQLTNLRESQGYAAADAVVRRIADRLRDAVPADALLARAGDNTFALALAGGHARAGAERDAARLAERLIAAIASPIRVCDDDLRLLACIGIARCPDDSIHAERLLSQAQAAMHFARDHGTRTCQVFAPIIGARAAQRVALEAELHRGLDRGEFLVHYQPRCTLPEGRVVGVEALLRWDHPERGLLPAAEFIGPAIATGLITPIGEAVLHRACKDAMGWPGSLALSVNLSTREFRGARLEEIIDRALAESGLAPERFHLELTESSLGGCNGESADEADVALVRLTALRERGLKLVLDNFGSAAGGLDLLRRCRADFVKIDSRLVRGIGADADIAAVVASIAALARRFGATVIAEGIEDARQAIAAVGAGCTEGQGFYLGRPVTGERLADVLHAPAIIPS